VLYFELLLTNEVSFSGEFLVVKFF